VEGTSLGMVFLLPIRSIAALLLSGILATCLVCEWRILAANYFERHIGICSALVVHSPYDGGNEYTFWVVEIKLKSSVPCKIRKGKLQFGAFDLVHLRIFFGDGTNLGLV